MCLAALLVAPTAAADLHRQAISHDAEGRPLELGATLAALGMHASAAGVYERIAARGDRDELAALAPLVMRTVRAVPHERTRAALRAYAPADARLFRTAHDREMFLYQLGRTPRIAGGEEALAAISDHSGLAGDAQLALSELRRRRGDARGAIAAAAQAGRSYGAELEAARLLAAWAHSDDALGRELARAELLRAGELTNHLAAFEHERLTVEEAGLLPGFEQASVLGAEALMFGIGCANREAPDLAPAIEAATTALVVRLDEILAIVDDAALADELTRSSPSLSGRVMAVALDRIDVREQGRWLAALEDERALHAAAPVAWRESRLGIRLRTSIGRDAIRAREDLGALARGLIAQVRSDLTTLAVSVAARTGPVSLHRGLGFRLHACARVLDPRPRPDPSPIRPTFWKCGTGCAGCASSGTAGLPVALALLWLFRSRRRSTTIGACDPR